MNSIAERDIQKAPVSDADKASIKAIKSGIRQASRDVRAQHGWLKYQNTIGLSIMLASIAGMVVSGYGYVQGWWPAWATLIVTGVFASLIHELEHDLIHEQYFQKHKWVQHIMYALGWIARPSTINPWIRKRIHLLHHKISGTQGDLEERGITNGYQWGIVRFICLFDGMAAVFIRTVKAFPSGRHMAFSLIGGLVSYFPMGFIHWGLWWAFLAYQVSVLVGAPLAYSPDFLATLNLLMVVWVGPNMIRSFCLHFVSSNMHYFGDVQKGNFLRQTQVWTAWWMWPFQLFCFNFGSTHAIHHFIVGEPFYVRQMTARRAHQIMRENGVRFNDYGSFRRANRWATA